MSCPQYYINSISSSYSIYVGEKYKKLARLTQVGGRTGWNRLLRLMQNMFGGAQSMWMSCLWAAGRRAAAALGSIPAVRGTDWSKLCFWAQEGNKVCSELAGHRDLHPPLSCLWEHWTLLLPANQRGKLGIQAVPSFIPVPVRFPGQGQSEAEWVLDPAIDGFSLTWFRE